MLFGYPIDATQENWLHDCLCEIVLSVHECINGDKKLPKWPGIVPADRREQLKSRRGLRDRVVTYFEAATPLTIAERTSIATVMADQNQVANLLSGECDCLDIDGLPQAARQPILDLFGFGFGLLSDFGIRDRQYKLIHQTIGYQLCPFCGCEYFDSPKGPREALDHYLAESRYPFAATNLRNLAPIGHKCNSKYKLAKDILHRDDGSRRRAFDPYQTDELQVLVDGSQVNQGIDGPLISEWVVNFSIEGEETETWDQVFSIRKRYTRDILEERSFKDWLWEFRNWCLAAALQIAGDADVLKAMERYEQFLTSCGFNDRAFLKAAVFRMLLARCNEGCDRVWGVMRDLAGLPQPALEIHP